MRLVRRDFPDSRALAEGLAAAVAEMIEAGIAARGAASLAVSGGSTPALFLKTLGGMDLNWAQVTATLVDERWVDATNPRSNAKLVHDTLMAGGAAVRFVPLYAGGAPDAHALRCANALQADIPVPYDAVVLGMGTDGHTASFFPHGDGLGAALDGDGPLAYVRAEAAGEVRVTQVAGRLVDTRALFLHIEGAQKAKVLERALGAGHVADMPVRAILRQDVTPVQIYWCP